MKKTLALAVTATLVLLSAWAQGARVSDIARTKHNLSANSGGVESTETTEICVFCHTPHGANAGSGGPLWNRPLSGQTYTMYSSSSLDAASLAGKSLGTPEGSSKLCLSCHDGTIAIGTVSNEPGQDVGDGTIAMTGTETDGSMPLGTDGYTRRLGTDLTNDHPISINLDLDVAQSDGELREPSNDAKQEILDGGQTLVGVRGADGLASKPKLPLEPTGSGNAGQVQCASCHDPHITETDSSKHLGESIKFLRLNRFQLAEPTGTYSQENDIICLACHDKDGWETSAHALQNVAGETYKTTPAATREFPDGLPVYKAACLNCHDTHTESGAPRLMRAGADTSGKAAVEETCYQCHTTSANAVVNKSETSGSPTNAVPNIETEFGKSVRMPITTDDQRTTGNPAHDIHNADFVEDPANLNGGNNANRHAECTDCHNPHRVMRNVRFNGNADGLGDDTLRTHETGRDETSAGPADGREGNVASGVLRGAWGVDLLNPSFFRTSLGVNWPEQMTAADFEIKSGDPGNSDLSQAELNDNLTREYQLCFKCHSSYSQNDRLSGGRSETDIPLGGHGGATAANTNGLDYYTNVAAEFLSVNATNPPTSGTDQGEVLNTGGGADGNTEAFDSGGNSAGNLCGGGGCEPVASGPGNTNANDTSGFKDSRDIPPGSSPLFDPDINHRSWHPVVFPTGRDRARRGINSGTGPVNFRAPFADNIGAQTMYCSDCHGAEGSWDTTNGGADRSTVQGPHGSNTKFLLKTDSTNPWNPGPPSSAGITRLGSTRNNLGLCGNCHQPEVDNNGSGFYGNHIPDGNMGTEACMNCHIAIPHGWKNKAFLVNMRCVGPEAAGITQTCTSQGSWDNGQTIEPYYVDAYLRISLWAPAGSWYYEACGGDAMKNCASGDGY
ncbi:cytochrome c3 family protein [Motiliproteus sp. SC1-56]|uniref:cytochrome c3 family protein n=1 Tax=Motiliproteus sp. SC1-56 TaxID=2799565 RepID=UPI001A8FBD73|nr:cytochrome c3 family protein [Motiliproteus sp. SC1-56]